MLMMLIGIDCVNGVTVIGIYCVNGVNRDILQRPQT